MKNQLVGFVLQDIGYPQSSIQKKCCINFAMLSFDATQRIALFTKAMMRLIQQLYQLFANVHSTGTGLRLKTRI